MAAATTATASPPPSGSHTETFKSAKKSKDKSIKRSLATYKKWKAAHKATRKEHKALGLSLHDREKKEVFDVVNAYKRRLDARFERKHKADLERMRAMKTERAKSTRLMRMRAAYTRVVRRMRVLA